MFVPVWETGVLMCGAQRCQLLNQLYQEHIKTFARFSTENFFVNTKRELFLCNKAPIESFPDILISLVKNY